MIFEAERQKRKVIHGLSRYQPAFLLTRMLYITNIYFKEQINVREDQHRMKSLRDIPVGSTATVVKIHGEGALKRRIMDMGITKGTRIYVRKVAPLGDPVEVTVRGFELSLRKEDADILEMQ